jgi:hypothetical protein
MIKQHPHPVWHAASLNECFCLYPLATQLKATAKLSGSFKSIWEFQNLGFSKLNQVFCSFFDAHQG